MRYDSRYFQIERQSQRPPARATVQVYEAADGQIEIRYRNRAMRHQELPAATLAVHRATAPSVPPSRAAPARRRGQPHADHPWHQSITQHRAYQQCARDRRAWKRGQP